MKRLMHYLKVRRRAIRIRRLTGNVAETMKSQIVKTSDLYNDDNDLGYC